MINKIINGDSLLELSKFTKESIDLMIIDPPYNQIPEKWDTFTNEEKFFKFTKQYLSLCYDILKDGGSVYLFNNEYNLAHILPMIKELGFNYQNWIIWVKKDGLSSAKYKYVNSSESILFFTKGKRPKTFNFDDIRTPYESTSRMAHAQKKGILKNGKRWFPNPNGKLTTNIWEFSSARHKKKVNGKTQKLVHPTVKPHDLIKRMILASSNVNDIVLDPFAGSGTTGFVCRELNRQFILIEKENVYFKYIEKELKNNEL